MALRSLRANLFRSALTLLGVIIGVAAVVTMLAIGDGSKREVMQRIESMGTNLLLIRPGRGMRGGDSGVNLTTEDAELIAELPNVTAVAPERGTSSTLRFGNSDHRAMIQGVWPGFMETRDWQLASGTFITEADLASFAPVIVLGQTVAENLFPNGEDPVGRYVLVRNVPFEVVGVLAEKGANAFGQDQDDVAVVPLSTGFVRLFGQQHLDSITVKVADAAAVHHTEATIQELLAGRHSEDAFRIRNTASILETAEAAHNTFTLLLGSVAAISLLVGGIGVMNIMLVNVTERTREIGVRMATGARAGSILLQFNTEALVVCGIGGLIGVGLGLGAAAALGLVGMPVLFSFWPPILAFSFAFATGLLFGYLPARKAAQLDPVVALASE
ncbi:ABC transporter permease [Alkalilimnicola ehrlichii]|nr:ABC transporter permease [Alkalilimnicola ehrlichii]